MTQLWFCKQFILGETVKRLIIRIEAMNFRLLFSVLQKLNFSSWMCLQNWLAFTVFLSVFFLGWHSTIYGPRDFRRSYKLFSWLISSNRYVRLWFGVMGIIISMLVSSSNYLLYFSSFDFPALRKNKFSPITTYLSIFKV